MFILYANKTQLTMRRREPVTSGSVNAYQVQFLFSEDWDGLEKTAVFQAGCVEKAAALTGGACTIPAEVLREPGHFLMVGVCGKHGETAVLPTVWANLGMILEGAVPSGSAPEPGPAGPQGPAGSGADLTAGDGMSKEGDVLNVDNPVRGILTLAEFNALTDAQKASGTYFVDDGAVAGGCGKVYSTQEQRIGTWVDGRPLYQRTVLLSGFPFSAGSSSVSLTLFPEGVITEEMEPVNIYGRLDANRYRFMVPSLHLSPARYTNGWGLAAFKASGPGDGYITVEYTKTTDQAPEEVSV